MRLRGYEDVRVGWGKRRRMWGDVMLGVGVRD